MIDATLVFEVEHALSASLPSFYALPFARREIDSALAPSVAIQLLQQTPECSLILLPFFANLIKDVPNQPDPAIQPNQACCVKPSLNGNSNSTASNYLNLRRIREQRLISAAVAARILKLSASANHTASGRPNTRTYYTKKERQALSLK